MPSRVRESDFGTMAASPRRRGCEGAATGGHGALMMPRRAESDPQRQMGRRWRPNWLTIFISLLFLSALGVYVYPEAAQWFSTVNQSSVVRDYEAIVDNTKPDKATQLRAAHDYNKDLVAGVDLEANTNVPTSRGRLLSDAPSYEQMLRADDEGLMARIRIPSIDVDLPIYHGTDDATLLKGAGHLEGSSLPVGGEDTHAVITAHRGLANATMFTNLDKVKIGDRFTIEVFGEVLTYQVSETKVVEPEDTDSLRAVQGKDLVTLVTCTPLGINTHRILVTGTRVIPTPASDVQTMGQAPTVPFPWWAVKLAGGLTLIGLYVWRMGVVDARLRKPLPAQTHP